MRAVYTLTCALAITLASGVAVFTGTERVQVSNARINPINGLVQADVVLTAPPLPRANNITGRIRVVFIVAGSEETVDASLSAVNVRRTVNSTRPFPCNETLPVTVKVVEPAEVAGHKVTSELTRKCSASQGTPDLTVVDVKRTDRGIRADAEYLQQPRETPIQLTIILKNASQYALPFNEQGGTPWKVQVTPGAPMQGAYAGTQSFRLPLQPNQEHRMMVQPVALPCGKISEVTVVVDSDKVILESDETNNRKVFRIPGNRCQDS